MKKKIIIIFVIIFVVTVSFIGLYIKVPTVYFLVNYGCTPDDYYKMKYEEKWNVSLSDSRLLLHETVDTGYDGGGTIYTVFQLNESQEISESWLSSCNREKNTEIEERIIGMINHILNESKEKLLVPDFTTEYYWKYDEEEITGTGANGKKVEALLYFPDSKQVYSIEGLQ